MSLKDELSHLDLMAQDLQIKGEELLEAAQRVRTIRDELSEKMVEFPQTPSRREIYDPDLWID